MRISPLVVFLVAVVAAGGAALVVSLRRPAAAPEPAPVGRPRPKDDGRDRRPRPMPPAPEGPVDIGALSGTDAAAQRKYLQTVQGRATAAEADRLFEFATTTPDPGLRVLAFAALGGVKDADVASRLLALFRTSTDPHMRLLALEEAGNIGGPEVEGTFVGLLKSPEDGHFGARVSDIVARMLADVERPEVVEALATYLAEPSDSVKDPRRDARGMLVEELGMRGGAKRVAVLLGVASNPRADRETRDDAINALGEMEGREALAALKRLLADALASAVPSDPEADIRKPVVDALGNRTEPEAAAILASILHGERVADVDLSVAAAHALGGQALEGNAALLLAVARDPSRPDAVRAASWFSYGRCCGPAGADVLAEGALTATTERERLSAARGLGFIAKVDRKTAAQRVLSESKDSSVRKIAQGLL